MAKFIGSTGLTYLWGKIKSWVSGYVGISSSTGKKTITVGNAPNQNSVDIYDWAQASSKPGYNLDEIGEGTTSKHFTQTEKTKLSGIATGAEVNQSAFSNVKVGSTTIAADTKMDTLEIAAGGDVSLTPDANSDKVTISVTTPKKVSDLTNDLSFMTPEDMTAAASSTTPKMNGTAAVGTENKWAHGDHVHPTDTSRAAASHTHGNITNAGALQTTDVAIASGDKLVITDSSNSGKVARASAAFDGSDTTTALTKKGTFEEFYQKPSTGIPLSDLAQAVQNKLANAASTVNIEFTRSGSSPNYTYNTNGHTWSELMGYDNTDTLVFVTISTSTEPIPCVFLRGTIGDYLCPITFFGPSSSTNTMYPVSEGTNDAIVVTEMIIENSVVQNMKITGNPGATKGVSLYGEKYANNTTSATGQLTVNENGITLTTSNGGTATLNGSAIATAADIAGRASSTHVHGNITNDGKITAAGVAIANNDTLVIVDASDSSKLKQTSIKFDGSTATKALTQKGTFETFNNYTHPTTDAVAAAAVKVGKDELGHVVIGAALAKGDLGLGNVENKSSATIRGELTSANVTTALGFTPINPSAKGAANGVCPLDGNKKIDSQYLPSYVDDVIEAYIRANQTALSATWLATGSATGTVITPEAGKIYVLMNSSTDYPENTQFRWGGSAYVKLNDGGISEMTTTEMDTATENWS